MKLSVTVTTIASKDSPTQERLDQIAFLFKACSKNKKTFKLEELVELTAAEPETRFMISSMNTDQMKKNRLFSATQNGSQEQQIRVSTYLKSYLSRKV